MHLRSGTVLADKFTRLLEEDNNRWPNERQAFVISTHTLDKQKFISHIKWLMTYYGTLNAVKPRELKANRLILMATARSLMNVSHDVNMNQDFRRLVLAILAKLNDYNGEILEFNINDYISDFKAFTKID